MIGGNQNQPRRIIMEGNTYKELRRLTQPGTIILTCTPKLLAGVSPEGILFALTTYDPRIFLKLPFVYRGARFSLYKLKPNEVYIPIVGPTKVNRILVSKGELAIRLNQALLVGERCIGGGKGEVFVSLHSVESIVLDIEDINAICELTTGHDAIQKCVEHGEDVYGLTNNPGLLQENGTINLDTLHERINPWITGETGARTDMFTNILHNTVEARGNLDSIHEILEALDSASRTSPVKIHPHKTGASKNVESAAITGVEWLRGKIYEFWYETYPPRIFGDTTQPYWLWERTH